MYKENFLVAKVQLWMLIEAEMERTITEQKCVQRFEMKSSDWRGLDVRKWVKTQTGAVG